MVTIPQTPVKEPHAPVTVLAIQRHLIVEEDKNSTVSVNKQTNAVRYKQDNRF